MIDLVCTCPAGLSELLLEELREFGLEAATAGDSAVILPACGYERIPWLNHWSTLSERVGILLDRGSFAGAADLRRRVESLQLPAWIHGDLTFAVAGERRGCHDFTSPQLAALVGGGLNQVWQKTLGHPLRADLRDPDLSFHVQVQDADYLLFLDTSGARLSRRYSLPFQHYAPLNPVLAAAMVRLSGFRRHGQLIDPMCGGGTILIEAAMLAVGLAPATWSEGPRGWERHPWSGQRPAAPLPPPPRWSGPAPRLTGADRYGGKIGGLRANWAHLGLPDLRSVVGSAFNLNWMEPGEAAPLAVLNPPYGIRVSRPYEVDALYEGFARAAAHKGIGEIVAISPRRGPWAGCLRKNGYEVNTILPVANAGLHCFLMRAVLPGVS